MKTNIKKIIISIMLLVIPSTLLAIDDDVDAQNRYHSGKIPTLAILSYNIALLCEKYTTCRASRVYDALPVDQYNFELITDEANIEIKHILTKTINNYWTIRTQKNVWFVIQTDPEKIIELLETAKKNARDNNFEVCIEQASHVLELKPEMDDVYFLRGYCYLHTDKIERFVNDIQRAISLDPNNYEYHNQLGWFYATYNKASHRDGNKALQYALMAVSLNPNTWVVLDTLAAAYARNGQFAEAIAAEKKAIEKMRGHSLSSREKQTIIKRIQSRIQLYESHQPYVDGN